MEQCQKLVKDKQCDHVATHVRINSFAGGAPVLLCTKHADQARNKCHWPGNSVQKLDMKWEGK